ncbi:Laminin subunit alpha-2 [Dissostichus eleginoides]|uniref:Laminin subunit alpha-2 n=1 Tax=Dissostichus eleginoides TaxID=100907 RepID=A0AAD9BJ57_DISEL|nr:Laminin subunit alpha-2 [Dissostichus eleginoides]
MVVFRNEQDKSHADELVRLQSLTVKENEENEILKKVVEDLQEQLEESRMQILIQEDLTTKKEGDIAERIHTMVESVTASHQLELRESSETNIQNTRKLEEERLALSETNANITAELDSVRAHKQAEIEQLRQALNDFHDMVVFRNEQDKSHADELVRLQSLTAKENEENEILKKVVEDLQEQLEESRMQILIQEDLQQRKKGTLLKGYTMVESVTASHQLELRESSETNIQNTRKLEEERLALSETNANITAELDSVRAHKQAEIEQLRQALNDFQDMVVFRNEQDKSHADELVRLQSLTVKENEENEILKKLWKIFRSNWNSQGCKS